MVILKLSRTHLGLSCDNINRAIVRHLEPFLIRNLVHYSNSWVSVVSFVNILDVILIFVYSGFHSNDLVIFVALDSHHKFEAQFIIIASSYSFVHNPIVSNRSL